MIYVDSSVVLAQVLSEDVRPVPSFWSPYGLASSRLTEFECWVRVHAYGKAETHGAMLGEVLAALDLVSLDESACARCRAPFPTPVRTLDAVHLAAADFLRLRGFSVQIATYDARMQEAAAAMGFGLAPLA
jgi:hypothetical protein